MQKDWLDISINLRALLEEAVFLAPAISTFEVPFQKQQNGRAKPVVIALENAPLP